MSIPLALGLAYAALAALVLNLNLHSAWRREIKIAAIVLVTLFYVAAYWGNQNLRGWALASQPPNPFRLHWAVVEEPDKARNTKGAIYILGQKLSPHGALLSTPRLYRLPFSPELAEQIDDALEAREDGTQLEATLSYKSKKPEEDAAKRRRRDGIDSRPDSRAESERLRLDFRALAAPLLPPKSSR